MTRKNMQHLVRVGRLLLSAARRVRRKGSLNSQLGSQVTHAPVKNLLLILQPLCCAVLLSITAKACTI